MAGTELEGLFKTSHVLEVVWCSASGQVKRLFFEFDTRPFAWVGYGTIFFFRCVSVWVDPIFQIKVLNVFHIKKTI